MQISVRWLGEWVDVSPSPSVLAEELTSAGLEVSAVEAIAPLSSKIVVGSVVSNRDHRSVSSLGVCSVSVGRAQNVRIVSEDSNIRMGAKVAVALPGTTLPSGKVIRRATVDGELSGGLLCSAADIGLEENSEGILGFDDSANIGQTVMEHLRLDDTILDI